MNQKYVQQHWKPYEKPSIILIFEMFMNSGKYMWIVDCGTIIIIDLDVHL